MLMVITGAGASYDSVAANSSEFESHEYRPPLAKDLFKHRACFDEAIRAYPDCVSIANDLREHRASDGLSLEQRLEELEREAAEWPARARHIAAVKFYLRNIIGRCGREWYARSAGMTHYSRLVTALGKWQARSGERVIFLTFNYDTLLDLALRDVLGMQFTHPNHYVDGNDFRLYKLHGSVNWGRVIDAERPPNASRPAAVSELIAGAGGWSFSGDFVVIGEDDPPRMNDEVAVFPALSIPVASKTADSFECPPGHLARLRDDLPQVDKVIVIGWAGAESHFTDAWRSLIPNMETLRFHVVNGSYDWSEAGQHALHGAGFKGCAWQCFDGGFAKYVRDEGWRPLFEHTGRWSRLI